MKQLVECWLESGLLLHNHYPKESMCVYFACMHDKNIGFSKRYVGFDKANKLRRKFTFTRLEKFKQNSCKFSTGG